VTNIARLEVELDLDSGKFTGKLTAANQTVQVFGSNVDKTTRMLQKMQRRMGGVVSSLRDFMVILGQARGAMHTLWGITGQWVMSIIDANAEIERLTFLMKGMSRAATEEMRMEEATRDLQYVMDMARSAPFSMGAIANSFVKLKSTGIDPTIKAMGALTNAVAAFGGDDQVLHRATIAVQQMAGKGVISMEELRQQLGEAVPNAIRLMARSMGMSIGELTKLISEGRVESMDALDRMFDEMDVAFRGRALDMMGTWKGIVAQIKTEWLTFAQAVGDGGLFEEAKEVLTSIRDYLGSADGLATARELGRSLGEVVKVIGDFTKYLINNRQELVSWAKFLGMALVSIKIGAIVRGLMSAKGAIGGLIASFGAARAAGLGVAGSFKAVGAGLAALVGPAAVIAGGIAFITMRFWEVNRAAKEARQELLNFEEVAARGDLSTREQELQARKSIEVARRLLTDVENTAGTPITGWQARSKSFARKRLEDYVNEIREAAGQARVKGDEAIEILRQMQSRLQTQLNEQVQLRIEGQFADSFRHWAEGIENSTNEVYRALEVELADIYDRMVSADPVLKISKEEATQQRVDAINRSFGQILDTYRARRQELEQELAASDGVDANIVKNWQERLNQLKIMMQRVDEERQRRVDNSGRPATLLERMGLAGAAADKDRQRLESYFQTLEARVGSLQERLADGNGEMGKFQALLNSGRFGANPDTGLQAQIRATIEELDRLETEWNQNNALKEISAELDSMMARADADFMTFMEGGEGELFRDAARGLATFNRQVEVARVNLEATGQSFDQFAGKVDDIRARIESTNILRVTESLNSMAAAADAATMTTRQRLQVQYQDQITQIDQLLERYRDYQGDKTAILEAAERARLALEQQFHYESMTAYDRWIKDWIDVTDEMEDVWANAMGHMSNALVDMVKTGKFSFNDLADTILTEILRVMTNKLVAQFISGFLGMFTGGAGFMSTGNFLQTTPHAKGGVFGPNGSVDLPFRAYAKGGVAKSPQLALFGEGSMPEAYVPLPDGRSIPVTMKGGGGNVQVNVINQSGQQVEAQETGRHFDGEKMILDVVLSAVNRPGKFRDNMKGAMR
jgi:lambda family phage tail tape measure protein